MRACAEEIVESRSGSLPIGPARHTLRALGAADACACYWSDGERARPSAGWGARLAAAAKRGSSHPARTAPQIVRAHCRQVTVGPIKLNLRRTATQTPAAGLTNSGPLIGSFCATKSGQSPSS